MGTGKRGQGCYVPSPDLHIFGPVLHSFGRRGRHADTPGKSDDGGYICSGFEKCPDFGKCSGFENVKNPQVLNQALALSETAGQPEPLGQPWVPGPRGLECRSRVDHPRASAPRPPILFSNTEADDITEDDNVVTGAGVDTGQDAGHRTSDDAVADVGEDKAEDMTEKQLASTLLDLFTRVEGEAMACGHSPAYHATGLAREFQQCFYHEGIRRIVLSEARRIWHQISAAGDYTMTLDELHTFTLYDLGLGEEDRKLAGHAVVEAISRLNIPSLKHFLQYQQAPWRKRGMGNRGVPGLRAAEMSGCDGEDELGAL